MQSESRGNQWIDIEDKYKVLQVIGQGSFGTVIKAEHKRSKKQVAIKLIADIYNSPYTFKKVIREI